VKVARAMELLHRHFDIVTLGDHDTFMGKLLDWTGWTRANTCRMGNVSFSLGTETVAGSIIGLC
jgi:hypothetical protein